MHRLTPHPATPPLAVTGVQVRTRWLAEGELLLRWRIDGARQVVLPPEAGRGRADDLWKTTCFEMFLSLGEGSYREFNFSPSGQWAAWDFSSYRLKQGDAPMIEEPKIEVQKGDWIVAASVRVADAALIGRAGASLCAVIEEKGGHLSFWAMSHRKEKPDFHDGAGFKLDLGAGEEA